MILKTGLELVKHYCGCPVSCPDLSVYDIIGRLSVLLLGYIVGNAIGVAASATFMPPLAAGIAAFFLVGFVSTILAEFVSQYFSAVFRRYNYVA